MMGARQLATSLASYELHLCCPSQVLCPSVKVDTLLATFFQHIPSLQPGASQQVIGSRQLLQLMGCRDVPSSTLHCCTMQDQLAEQAEQAQFQIKALQAKAEKLQLAADQALAQKREAEQQRKASEREAHNTKQALDARVVRHAPVPGLLSAQVYITSLSSTRPKSPG